MSWKFNPPPGWPQQPEGWVPPPGWTPDPSWPAPPAGWQFWVAADAGQASSPPASTPPASTPPATPPPVATSGAGAAGASTPYPPSSGAGQAPSYQGGAAAAPAPAQPSSGGTFGGGYPSQSSGFGGGGPAFSSGQPAYAGGAPSYQPAAGGQGKPWFAQWWTILVLIVLLLVGLGAGFGGTRVALELAAEESTTEPTAAGGDQTATVPSPEPTELPFVPSEPPIEPPGDDATLSGVCGPVAVIFLGVTTAGMEEVDDLDEYLDGVIDARRDAAAELRELETDDPDEQDGLDTLANELDDAAQQMDDNRRDIDEIEDSFEKAVDAYFAFNDDHC